MAFKIDFHVHTKYSFDSVNKPSAIIKKAKQLGLDAVVVLDHETVKGGQETAKLDSDDVLIIPSVEIYTDIGDIIGLFVDREIEAREYHEVIDEIHNQGGLVMLPHPFYKHKFPDDLWDMVDLIEINNSRAVPDWNVKAAELAVKHNIPAVSGSDGHFSWEIGNAITIFEDTPSSQEKLTEMILNGNRTHQLKYSSPIGIILGQTLKYWRRPDKIIERLKKLAGMDINKR
ncbi:MAG: PHP domain-containing protein [candidate division Zixibacteria bacterium]|nr:PHP domain-containing protein [candidate division Zixibacteria bacterium]